MLNNTIENFVILFIVIRYNEFHIKECIESNTELRVDIQKKKRRRLFLLFA